MKKNIVLVSLILAIFGLNGCGGGGGGYNEPIVDDVYIETPINDNLTTLFLVDEYGYSDGGIPYICDSMIDWDITQPNGEFSFLQPDNCTFDFLGLDGTYGDDFDQIIRIVDLSDDGKEAIPYECENFGVGSTYIDGSFDYDIDDQCVFFL